MRLFVVLLCFGLALVAAPAGAEEPSAAHRPKVGLVLSGGGALGLAHVGVLQELERQGVRPDVIVGVSMGAILGGLYASGYSADELEKVVRELDWTGVFAAAPPRAGLSYRQKQDDADFPVKGRIALSNGGLKLPGGVISDQNLLLTLRSLDRAEGRPLDFDDLPIPFRAVATDIETGAPVVIGHGALSDAMRASMSVPGVFQPIELDGRLLVDGGLAANIPVDVARAMGAERVIVVALQTHLLKKDEINSALDVVGQTVNLLIRANEQAQLATLQPGDVLIDLDVSGYTPMDFKRGLALIEPARQAAAAQEAKLAAFKREAPSPPRYARRNIDFIRIENGALLSDDVIAARLRAKPGAPLDIEQLKEDLTRIYALGAFERVGYRVIEEGGRAGLVIEAPRKRTGIAALRVGLSLDNDFEGESNFAVSFDYSVSPLDAFGAEWRVEGVLGDQMRLGGEIFKPLDSLQRYFFSPRALIEARNVIVYAPTGEPLGEYRARYGIIGLDAGRQFGGWGELRLGLERGVGKADGRTNRALLEDQDIDIGQAFVSLGVDTLDDAFFPRRGMSARLRFTHGARDLGARSDFETLAGGWRGAFSRRRHTVVLGVEGGETLSGAPPVEQLFRLGGLFSLSGYRRDELAGEAYGVAGAVYRLKLNNADPRFFGVPIYAGFSIEAGNAWADADDAWRDPVYAGSIYLAADTFLGPVYLSYGRSEEDRRALYLFIGRPF